MIIDGAQRLWTPSAPSGIVGKPTVAFSPNRAHPYYPNYSSCFFTELIAGATDYVDDDVPGRADVYQGGGNFFGYHTHGEGWETVITNASGPGIQAQVAGLTNESFAAVFEFACTNLQTSGFNYIMGWTTSFENAFTSYHSSCSGHGAFYSLPSEYFPCLGDFGDYTLRRMGIKCHRTAASKLLTIVLDGNVLIDEVDEDTQINGQPFRFGLNTHGKNNTLFASGMWHWAEPFDGNDPLSKQALIDLTTDPWPYLVTLD